MDTLRRRRETLGLSRPVLALKAGISAPAIEQFENGYRPKESKALTALEQTLARLEAQATKGKP